VLTSTRAAGRGGVRARAHFALDFEAGLAQLTTTGSRSSSGAVSSSTLPPPADGGHERPRFDAIGDHRVIERL